MNEIQEMKDRRDQLTSEMESLRAALIPYEAALENPETIEQGQEREVRDQYNERKRKIDSLDMELYRLNPKIQRRENLANCDALMTGFIADMANWAADEIELNEKRQSLSNRLEEVRQQAQEEIASARQAETLAATAYAQAVAWGDVEGEKAASSDAQKAAKNLTTATEQNRRQQLIITALEQELVTIDRHITEAQEEHQKIQQKALRLAHDALEERWNEAARALLDVGGKLYAAGRLIGRDPVSLMKLDIPEQGENFGSWRWSELADRGRQHGMRDLLSM
ncbi:chromosome segregation protein SMC [Pseudomonas sp. PDM03]|uniref:chromosome segregation protein SMC n=1 Tax=Pseudomonas sp. PDM03 TaxID=2769266 RepID=UPI00177B6527|nr:chromosome segregation protein SMC [Pseudomonas sp. PDM03]MBD9591082.1 chromosome segregation protein SMC [Pseudomonas sp. PDM03]